MASPLSVGDCIAIIDVVVKGIRAVSGTSDDAKELGGLIDDVLRLKNILEQVPKQGTFSSANQQARINDLDGAVRHCHGVLLSLAAVLKEQVPVSSGAKRFYRRITWTFRGKKKTEPLQKRLQSLTTNVLLIQSGLQRQAIDDLNGVVQKQGYDLSTQLAQGHKEIKMTIYAAIDEPPDQAPIKFRDATGDKYQVPLNLCLSFEDFCDFLGFIFRKNKILLPFVTRKNFWLFTPAVNGSPWWYLIHENDWVQAARPGSQLGMSIFDADSKGWVRVSSRQYEPTLQAEASRNAAWSLSQGQHEDYYARFSNPVPAWSSLPQDLEFRWWYAPREV